MPGNVLCCNACSYKMLTITLHVSLEGEKNPDEEFKIFFGPSSVLFRPANSEDKKRSRKKIKLDI